VQSQSWCSALPSFLSPSRTLVSFARLRRQIKSLQRKTNGAEGFKALLEATSTLRREQEVETKLQVRVVEERKSPADGLGYVFVRLFVCLFVCSFINLITCCIGWL
jgi:hypothetical protein